MIKRSDMKTENPKAVKSYEDIVSEIEDISAGINKLMNSRLTERAIVVLIHDALPSPTYSRPRIGRGSIREVLQAASHLKDIYIKKLKSATPE